MRECDERRADPASTQCTSIALACANTDGISQAVGSLEGDLVGCSSATSIQGAARRRDYLLLQNNIAVTLGYIRYIIDKVDIHWYIADIMALSVAKTRLVRLPLPAELVRNVDELVLRGAGGYESRLEFMQEAIQNAVFEYKFPDGSNVARPQDRKVRASATGRVSDSADHGDLPIELIVPRPQFVLETSDAKVEDVPMLGLHNRDYPTLWATVQLATIVRSGPVEVEKALREVTERAWRFGEHLLRMEQRDGQRCTALFPTNWDKRNSSEANFRSFAIGRYLRTEFGIKASGPVFQWKLCGLKSLGRETGIALLPGAVQLLDALNGISAAVPHSEQHALAFLHYLADASPADWKTLMLTLKCVSRRPTRQEVIARLNEAGIGATAEQGSSYAAGYIARAREWGLVEPKLVDGRYVLSRFGETTSGH